MPDLPAYRKHVLAALQFADVIKASDEVWRAWRFPILALERAASAAQQPGRLPGS
jgi:hypothetical protein